MESIIGSRLLEINDNTINKMALSSINWVLGANPMRKSFVSGYGDDCIKTIFGTFNNDGKTGIPGGYMPGGPNRYQGVGLSIFPAKCYLDSADEWTTNEHTTGWNSILVFMTAFADKINYTNNTIPGDINGDSDVNSLDYVLIRRYILGILTKFPSEGGYKAADMNNDGLINSIDYIQLRALM